MTSNYTVGYLLDNLPLESKIPFNLNETDRNRLISNPPEILADKANLVFKIKLADGNYLNLHVVHQ